MPAVHLLPASLETLAGADTLQFPFVLSCSLAGSVA
jgi:hypothetical protein